MLPHSPGDQKKMCAGAGSARRSRCSSAAAKSIASEVMRSWRTSRPLSSQRPGTTSRRRQECASAADLDITCVLVSYKVDEVTRQRDMLQKEVEAWPSAEEKKQLLSYWYRSLLKKSLHVASWVNRWLLTCRRSIRWSHRPLAV